MAMTSIDTMPHDTIPDSPPELSSSRSSKSSNSFQSSCLSDATGPENLSHFEDISLSEAKRDSYDLHHAHKRAHARPSPRPLHSASGDRKRGMHTIDTGRSLHSGRPRLYAVQGINNGVLQETSPNMPMNRAPRYGFRHASSSAVPRSARQHDSRSPSPTKPLVTSGLSRSPSSVPNLSPVNFLGPRPALGLGRKTSRKSIKELEDEYHDSDEEIPEDAVVWNVPISPLPPFSATSRSTSPHKSAPRSSRGSSEAPTLGKQTSAPTSSSVATDKALPQEPPRLGLPRSATVQGFPSELADPPVRERTKSWQADLSDETRDLSAALEALVTRISGEQDSPVGSAPPSPPRPFSKSSSRATTVELPPIQRSNIMIDPLPISQEKEAVLARTRPSWLPPKCKKEEKKHLKEWEKMMAYSLQAEKRRAAKQLQEIEAARETKGSIARIWEEHVLPNWDTVTREPRTRELWWRGVTPKNRGTVWTRAIGNDLELTEASYSAALKRSKTIADSIAHLSSDEKSRSKEAAWHNAIDRDVPTVFPELNIFAKDSPLHDTLRDVLYAYAAYRSDVGYVHGVHLIAGLLILNTSAHESFIALANLLNRPLPLAYLVQDRAAIDRWQSLVLSTLKTKLPNLHAHLLSEKSGLDVGEWLEPMLSSLLTGTLDPDTASRVWDVYVFEGDKVLVRAIVGVLMRLEGRLYGSREEVLGLLGWDADRSAVRAGLGSEDEVIISIREAGKMGERRES